MSRQCIVAIYDNMDAAKAAIQRLDESKFPSSQISLVANSIQQDMSSITSLQYGDEATHDATLGAGVGGLLGFFMASPLLTIPGIGLMLIAGPISAGITGAIVGGFLGSLLGWGVHEDHLAEYEEMVRNGRFLIVANGDPFEIDFAKQVLNGTNARSVKMHAHQSEDIVQP